MVMTELNSWGRYNGRQMFQMRRAEARKNRNALCLASLGFFHEINFSTFWFVSLCCSVTEHIRWDHCLIRHCGGHASVKHRILESLTFHWKITLALNPTCYPVAKLSRAEFSEGRWTHFLSLPQFRIPARFPWCFFVHLLRASRPCPHPHSRVTCPPTMHWA